eukprot:961560-Prymnesium_polylepis.1
MPRYPPILVPKPVLLPRTLASQLSPQHSAMKLSLVAALVLPASAFRPGVAPARQQQLAGRTCQSPVMINLFGNNGVRRRFHRR